MEAVLRGGSGDRDLTGRQLGPYLLEAVVGEGAFGRVYRARHVELSVPRAVKVMRYALAGDRRFRDRFLREARMAARLDHPNIVSVHDFAAEADVQYLVMEYVDSLTLAQHLTSRPVAGRLYDPAVQAWIRDVASALDHAHGLGIVHRDLKPANVLIRSADQRAMLTDFGIAQALDEPGLTATGVAMGTYAYMSPEQARGEPDLTSAVDVYAFAAMLVEIATGEPPFGRGLAAVGGHLGSPVPTLDELGPDLARRARPAVAAGLAKDPADRVATAGDLADAFLRAVGDPGPAAAQQPAPAAAPPPAVLIAAEPAPPGPPDATDATVPARLAAFPAGVVAPPPAGPAPLLAPLGRWVRGRRAPLAAGAAAALLVAGVVAIFVAVAPRPAPPIVEPTVPPVVSPSPPVQASVGAPFVVSDLDVTVQAATAAPPPPTLKGAANDSLLVLDVSYTTDGRQGAIVSPYDWVLANADGTATYQAVVQGIDGTLPETTLPRGQTIQGRVAFLVPAKAPGLQLYYLAEVGDGSAVVALPPGV